jgi:iron complex transport system substrate-binding protein
MSIIITKRFLAAAFSAALVLAGCGTDDPDGPAGGAISQAPTTAAPATTAGLATTVAPATTVAAGFPVTVSTPNGDVTLDERPERIVSLSPTATEMLFAIGAGGQVVAVDDQSNYPPEAPVTDLSGFTPNLEAIASFEPDLVVASYDADGLVKALGTLAIPVLLHDAANDLDQTYEQITQLGALTGNDDGAQEVVAGMQQRIDEIVAGAPETSEPLRYFHELDESLYTVTSSTFAGQVYALLGLENIADAADDGSGYPQLSAEFLVEADPDVIFLADTKCCGQNAATVATRPGWSALTAVQNGAVVELDDDVASRWGPRTVEFLEQVAGALEQLAAG